MRKRQQSEIRSALLLISGCLFIAGSATWHLLPNTPVWFSIFYLVMFCAGGYAMVSKRRWAIAFLTLSVLGIIVQTIGNEEGFFGGIGLLLTAIAQALLFGAIYTHIAKNKDVSQVDRILAGTGGYLLLGIFWSFQFGWTSLNGSEGLIVQQTGLEASHEERFYFTFVTMTTLGFGDILPVTPLARVLTMFATLSGVLYLAIFISALVSGLKK